MKPFKVQTRSDPVVQVAGIKQGHFIISHNFSGM